MNKMNKWFEEILEVKEGRVNKISYKEKIISKKTKYQKIDVYDTHAFGKMLVHDDVIMLTEFDESHYHEMIVHVPLNTHGKPKNICIIGGGDGGSVRETLKHPEVENIDLCEIDRDVIDISLEYLPQISCQLKNSKVNIFCEDGAEFIKSRKNTYDVIIVDSSDPIGPAEILFQKEFYSDMKESLKEDGLICTQSESFLYHEDIVRKISKFSKELFPIYKYFYTMIPTYPSGVIGFSICSKSKDPIKDFNEERIKLLGELNYYNAGIHKSSFNLPQRYKF